MNFITGEKIQFSCDHFIGTEKDFKYNRNVVKYKDRFIYLSNTKEIDNKSLIFCYTHLLNNINELIKTLKTMKNPFKLFCHNSDHTFEKIHLILFENLPLLECIYTQNMNVIHEKVFPLPIGLANSQWGHGNLNIHTEIYKMHINKTKEIYFNFNINTNKGKRQECFNAIKNKGIQWTNNIPYKEYLIELKRHKYAICPEGNGIDSHRFWECLYLNTIPICKINKLVEYYQKYFSIVILNDWSELDLKLLENNYAMLKINHTYLDMNYIKKYN